MAGRRISRDETAELAGAGPPLPPVHAAIMNNDVSTLASLIKSGSAQLHPENLETPLHTAARTGTMECLKWLLENHVKSPLDRARNRSTPAHYATVYGRLDALKLLVTHDKQKSKEITEQIDENGLSILSLATLQGNMKMVQWITENYPSVGHIPDNKGNYPIHFAAAGGSIEMIKYFVSKYGQEYAEKRDNSKTTPTYYAAQDGKIDVLKYMINEVGVDPVARDSSGMSTTHAAAMGHQLETVKWLVNKMGPKVIIDKTKDGATPLHIAAAHGCTEMLQFFIDSLEDKNDVNILDHIHATPAHDAAEFQQQEALLILLQNRANISIKDMEDKTPLDLALEKKNSKMVRMLKDYKERGVKGLVKYEQGRKDETSGTTSSESLKQRADRGSSTSVRTFRDEAEEISSVIMEASDVLEKRRDKELTRKKSLEAMNKFGSEDEQSDSADDLERQLLLGADRQGSRRSRSISRRSEEADNNALDRDVGPEGHVYTRVKKKAAKGKKRLDIDDQTSEASSKILVTSDADDPGYATVTYNNHNLETVSNYSRPSRVRNYPDNESELSYRSGSTASQPLNSGRHNVPGFYPPYGYYPPNQPMSHPLQHSKQPTRSISGSSLGSQGSAGNSRHHNYPSRGGYPMSSYAPYPYHPAMVAQYYGYPWSGQPYPQPKPKTTEERMHMEILQRRGHPPWAPPGAPPPGMHPGAYPGPHPGAHPGGYPGAHPGPHPGGYPGAHPGYPHHFYMKNHRARQKRKGGLPHKRPSSGRSSNSGHTPHQVRSTNVLHRGGKHERDIGFGPTAIDDAQAAQANMMEDHTQHPPPPPVTRNGQTSDKDDIVVEGGNFFLVKPEEGSDGNLLSQTSGTRLNRAKQPINWDKYIMTDSEDDQEIPDHVSVARLNESSLICALAPVAALLGLNKIRKTRSPDNLLDGEPAHRSSAWDVSGDQLRSRSRRGSITEDAAIAALSPMEFANLEEQRIGKNWSQAEDGGQGPGVSATTRATGQVASNQEEPSSKSNEDWSSMFLKGVQPAPISMQLESRQPGGSLRIQNIALEQLAPSTLTSSRLSIDQLDDDDDDDDLISIIHGLDPSELEEKKRSKQSKKQAKESKKKDKSKKGKDKVKPKGEESATQAPKVKESRKDKHKSRSEKADKYNFSMSNETTSELGKGGAKGKSKGKSGKSAPPPPKTKAKQMTVVPSKSNEKQWTLSQSNEQPAATDHEVKLVSKVMVTPPTPTAKEMIASASVTNKTSREISIQPREVKTNFADSDSSEEAEGGLDDTGSLDDLFAATQKEIEEIIAGIPEKAEETQTKSASSQESEEETQHNMSSKLKEIIPSQKELKTEPKETASPAPHDMSSLMQLLKINADNVTPQQMLKMQMVQNILNYKDPELTKDLMNLLDQGWTPIKEMQNDPMDSSSSTQLVADLQSKIMDAQEKQRQETEQQIRSQVEFSQSVQKKLQEQAERHLENICEQLDEQRKLMLQQLLEQKTAWQEERRRLKEEKSERKNRKKRQNQVQQQQHQPDSESESDSVPSSRRGRRGRGSARGGNRYQFLTLSTAASDESDQELITAVPATPSPVTASKVEVKTMQAEIFKQDLLKWEDFENEGVQVIAADIPQPPPLPSAKYLLEAIGGRKPPPLKSRNTQYHLANTSQALHRFTSGTVADDSNEEEDISAYKTSRQAQKFQIAKDDSEDYTTDEQGVRLAAASARVAFVH